MKKFTLLLCLAMMISLSSFAQDSPIGVWVTVDDETNQPKSHVEVFERDGKLYGKIIKLLPAATTTVCIDCPGDKNGAALEGMEILWGFSKFKDYWSYGQIIDPASGKVYKCNMWIEDGKLAVKGYIGFSLIGRTQYWEKLN